MNQWILLLLVSLCLAGCAHAEPRKLPDREWTLLVFMNGKNNLEGAAIDDFREMAAVGSTSQVSVVVELGRLGDDTERRHGDWSGVKRFAIASGMKPTAAEALQTVGESIDMGDPRTLADFLLWGKTNYPAKNFLVVIWNHGQGWRLQRRADRDLANRMAQISAATATASLPTPALKGVQVGGFRAASSDDEFQTIMYNTDIAKAIGDVFLEKVSIIGFDACLMGMLETAYEMRSSGNLLVASAELEPGAGWDYEAILGYLKSNPAAEPDKLATQIVQTYAAYYRDREQTTLAAIRLDRIEAIVDALDALTIKLQVNLPDYAAEIASSRRRMYENGRLYDERLDTSVDLSRWLQELAQEENAKSVLEGPIQQVRGAIGNAVVENYYWADDTDPPFQSNGLSIYFPASQSSFLADGFGSGYEPSNTFKPVAFVKEAQWAKFLHSYWAGGVPR